MDGLMDEWWMDEKWSNSISVVVHNVYVHYCKLLTSTVVLDFTAISPCKVLIISSQSFSCITQTDRQTCTQTHTDRHVHRHRQTERRADMYTDTDRQTDRQTERQTDTETYIDRDTHRNHEYSSSLTYCTTIPLVLVFHRDLWYSQLLVAQTFFLVCLTLFLMHVLLALVFSEEQRAKRRLKEKKVRI